MTDHLSEAESALKRAQAAIDDYRGHTWPSAVIVVYGGIIDALDAIAAHREQQTGG